MPCLASFVNSVGTGHSKVGVWLIILSFILWCCYMGQVACDVDGGERSISLHCFWACFKAASGYLCKQGFAHEVGGDRHTAPAAGVHFHLLCRLSVVTVARHQFLCVCRECPNRRLCLCVKRGEERGHLHTQVTLLPQSLLQLVFCLRVKCGLEWAHSTTL